MGGWILWVIGRMWAGRERGGLVLFTGGDGGGGAANFGLRGCGLW